jgi:hypothetical protein
MKRRILFAVIAAAACLPVAVALGTPPTGTITRTNLTPFPPGSTIADTWKVNADGIKFKNKGPATTVFQTVTYAPAADSGWHLHPGVVFVAVIQGEVTRLVGCSSQSYKAGETFLETGDQPVGKLVNTGLEDAKLAALYVVPKGSPLSDPSPPAPDCSSSSGHGNNSNNDDDD